MWTTSTAGSPRPPARIVASAQDRLGQPPSTQRKREAFLEIGIVLDLQPLAGLGEEIDDVAHRYLLEVAEQNGIAKHEIVDVLVRIGREERGAAAAIVFDGVYAGLDDPAAGDDRDLVSARHGQTSEM